MKIQSVEFITSAVRPEHYPAGDLPEIVLSGRSNVGKSSFINSVLGRKNVAYISSKPGKTITLNFFKVNDAFMFVDVPGYGYARRSKKDIEAFAEMIQLYLTERDALRLVILLVDFRHEPSKDDRNMVDFLKTFDVPFIVIGTKMDKVSKNKRLKHEKMILKTLNIPRNQFIPYSSTTKENIEWVDDILKQATN
jgi:GTP-binding protein